MVKVEDLLPLSFLLSLCFLLSSSFGWGQSGLLKPCSFASFAMPLSEHQDLHWQSSCFSYWHFFCCSNFLSMQVFSLWRFISRSCLFFSMRWSHFCCSMRRLSAISFSFASYFWRSCSFSPFSFLLASWIFFCFSSFSCLWRCSFWQCSCFSYSYLFWGLNEGCRT